MRYTPEQITTLLDEVDTAMKRAAGPHPDLTIGERLDLWNHVDKMRSNRYDVLAQACRELLEIVPDLRQKWLRETHDIHIVIDREALDSDEMCYVYEVTYLKPEDVGSKHWVNKLTRARSFGGYGSTYYGGWNSYEEALAEAIKFSLTLIEKP